LADREQDLDIDRDAGAALARPPDRLMPKVTSA
jgi:hypothetical protein